MGDLDWRDSLISELVEEKVDTWTSDILLVDMRGRGDFRYDTVELYEDIIRADFVRQIPEEALDVLEEAFEGSEFGSQVNRVYFPEREYSLSDINYDIVVDQGIDLNRYDEVFTELFGPDFELTDYDIVKVDEI